MPFYVDDDHLKYWDEHSLPTILILHNPDEKMTIWQWADRTVATATEKHWRIDVPRTNIFDERCKPQLLDQQWSHNSNDLRRRFTLDRSLIERFEDQEAFVRIDKWVNKHLQYREIKIYFDDYIKDYPDYEIPIRATWNFDISDIMQHFLPWLDYGYYDEPEDISGEIEIHTLSVSLSQAAKGFLEAERFFEDPQFPEIDDYSDGLDSIEYVEPELDDE